MIMINDDYDIDNIAASAVPVAYVESLTFRVVYCMNLPHAFLLTTHVLINRWPPVGRSRLT